MKGIAIKRVLPGDLLRLQEISRQTFYETYSSANTKENMSRYTDEYFSSEKLAAELSDPNAEFYFAMMDHKIIGYLKVNFGPSQTELQDDASVEIERIYVLLEYQGKKIGKLFYEKSLQIAKMRNAHYVWLGVWEENSKAINFYRKNGFVEFDKHIFKLGNEEQTDIMMKFVLSSL